MFKFDNIGISTRLVLELRVNTNVAVFDILSLLIILSYAKSAQNQATTQNHLLRYLPLLGLTQYLGWSDGTAVRIHPILSLDMCE